MSQHLVCIALCALGLEKTVENELKRMGLSIDSREHGRIRFLADAASAFKANVQLRTAERVLVELACFPAPNFDDLFEGARATPWELFFQKGDRLVIERVRTRNSALASQTAIQSTVHKAAYERLMGKYKLAHMEEDGEKRMARVLLEGDICSIGLDLSGEALHKRGYRKEGSEAPLKETIAASLLFSAGWNRRFPFYDPFCGSGTIAIEAALYAIDAAPGLKRSFAIETMPFFPKETAARIRAELGERIKRDVLVRIAGSDIDPRVLAAAKANAARAGVADILCFFEGRVEDAGPDSLPFGASEGLVIIGNPPYGRRLGDRESARAVWTAAGGLRERFPEASMGFITDEEDFPKSFGAYPAHSRKIRNGADELYFAWYPGRTEGRGSAISRA